MERCTEKDREQIQWNGELSCMTQSEKRDRPLQWVGGTSDVSDGCGSCLSLLTSGYHNAPEPTHTSSTCSKAHTVDLWADTYPHTPPSACTHKPLCRELDSTIGAGVGQAYYSSPEGVVSLLTSRHKYSSTPSPRVNGCPSGSNETFRAACAWRRHTVWALSPHLQGHLWRLEKPWWTRSHTTQAWILRFSMFTWESESYVQNLTHTPEHFRINLHSYAPTHINIDFY